jgi:hypothetical protein
MVAGEVDGMVAGEVDDVVAVLGANGPWGRPHGPMEMHAVRRITDAPTGLVTTEMRHSSSSSSPPSSSLDGPMVRARGRHTTDPMTPRRGVGVRGLHRPVCRLIRGRGRGPLQHVMVWRGRRRRWWWGCRATIVRRWHRPPRRSRRRWRGPSTSCRSTKIRSISA